MRRTQKGIINCSEEDKAYLLKLSKSLTAPVREALRAKILLHYMDSLPINKIAGTLSITRKTVYNCIDKALGFGTIAALSDLSGRGVKALIGDDAKSWVISVACQSPRDYGYANEVWSYSLLSKQIQKDCQSKGYPQLQNAGKSVLHGILGKTGIKPHKISYYLERRDEEFDRKMAEVLVVYKEVELCNIAEKMASSAAEERKHATISYDEKPGIQAIKNIAAQLMPVPGKYATIERDYEYKRLGTLSLLAGIDGSGRPPTYRDCYTAGRRETQKQGVYHVFEKGNHFISSGLEDKNDIRQPFGPHFKRDYELFENSSRKV